jgi:TolB protein
VAGPAEADTIGALLSPLVVEVRGGNGQPLRGVGVRFESLPAPAPRVQFAAPPPHYTTSWFAATTDADGRAATRVRFGDVAGSAGVVVRVTELDLVHAVHFTIRVGAPAHLVLEPADTVVFTGTSLRLRSVLTDRGGNPLQTAVSFSVLEGPATVAGPGGYIATAGYGTSRIAGHAGVASATVQVAAVPRGALIAQTVHHGLVAMNFDGTGRITVADRGVSPTWSPSGDRVVYQTETFGGRLMTRTLTGTATPLLAADTTRGWHYWPRFSRDGAFVYFFTSAPGEPQEIWRVGAGGTGLERISPRPSTGFEGHPSPSPDGRRIAYFHDSAGVHVRVRDLVTGVTSGNLAAGHSPTWSPTEDLIAFNEYNDRRLGGILLVRPDGSGLRRLTPAGSFHLFGLDWSPDGRWILATSGNHPRLIEVGTGLTIQLPFLESVQAAAWKPGALLP